MSVLLGRRRPDERRDDSLRSGRRCRRCGYGIAPHARPERCPMCGGRVWDAETYRFATGSSL